MPLVTADHLDAPAAFVGQHGADNRHLRGVAHVRMVYEDAVFDDVLGRLSTPASTGEVFAIAKRRTAPLTFAVIVASIFIASMVATA